MTSGTRRRRIEPTDEWEQLALLCRWPEQLAYEEIREGPCAALRPLEQRFWCGVAQPGGHKAKFDDLVGVLGFSSCLAVTLMYPWGYAREAADPPPV